MARAAQRQLSTIMIAMVMTMQHCNVRTMMLAVVRF